MPRIFTAEPLRLKDAAQAYPLVQAAISGLTFDRWTAFVKCLTGPRRKKGFGNKGLMMIRSDRGYIHGLFSYSATVNLQYGRALLVDNFIAADVISGGGAAQALRDVMEDLAFQLDCDVICLRCCGQAGDGADVGCGPGWTLIARTSQPETLWYRPTRAISRDQAKSM